MIREAFRIKSKLPGLEAKQSVEEQVEQLKGDIARADQLAATRKTPGWQIVEEVLTEIQGDINKVVSNEHSTDEELRRANIKSSLLSEFTGKFKTIEARSANARTMLERLKESHHGR